LVAPCQRAASSIEKRRFLVNRREPRCGRRNDDVNSTTTV
jgi:hypothetical protein